MTVYTPVSKETNINNESPTRGPAEKVSVLENRPGKFAAEGGKLSHLSGLMKYSE